VDRIDEFIEGSGFSGAVSIYSFGQPLYERALGYRDLPNSLPNTISTLFGLASGTKTLTAVGILRLVEKGFTDLSTPVSDVMGKDCGYIADNAEISHLLNHTSGVYDYYDEDEITDFDDYTVAIPWNQLESPQDYLPLFEAGIMKFRPGERVSYSNGGYVLLGIIIEKLTNNPFREFMRREVFEPFGMNSTGFHAFNHLPPNTALGYMKRNGEWISNIYQLPLRGAGDGGLYSNSRDMNSFWMKLMNQDLVSRDLVRQMTDVSVEIHKGLEYGYGLYIDDFHGYRSYTSSGCDCGVGFSSTFVPDISLNINIFSNRTEGDRGVFSFIEKELNSISF